MNRRIIPINVNNEINCEIDSGRQVAAPAMPAAYTGRKYSTPTKRLVVLFVLIFAAMIFADDLPQIAVYVTGDVPENEKKALGTRMLSSLINSKRYKGIERSESFLAEIEKEHVKQRSGDIDDGQISKLGKQFGVKFICIADITPAYRAFQVSARIVNVETAEVAFIGEAISPLKSAKDFSETSDKVVANMLGIERKKKSWMSAGIGFLGAGELGGGLLWPKTDNLEAARVKMPYQGGGAYLFFDALYGQATVAFALGGGKWESGNVNPDSLPDMQRMSLSFGLYGKYPYYIGSSQRIALFPLLGFEYEMSLSGKIENPDGTTYAFDGGEDRPSSSALSAAWVKLGGGADFNINDNIYLRTELLYGLRGANTFENNMAALERDAKISAEAKSGTGAFLKVGAGYRF